MPFLRQSYKQKPQAYGPPSVVQASIFQNAERKGIDPASIALAMPMWGPGDQLDYSKNKRIFTPGSGVSYSKKALQTTNDADGIIDLGSSFSFGTGSFTIIQSCKIDTINNFSLSSRSSSVANGYEFLIGGASVYGDVSLRWFDNEGSKTTGTKSGLNDGKYHQLAGVLGKTGRLNVDGVDVASSPNRVGQITNSQNLFIDKRGTTYRTGDHNYLYIFTVALPTGILAYLSDNPYFLLQRVAPVFYVDMAAGGSTLSPINDSVSLSDNVLFLVNRFFSDSVGVSDSQTKTYGSNVSDTVNISDQAFKSAAKSFSDTFSLSDNFNTIITLILVLNDAISLADGVIQNIGLNTSDNINLSDQITKLMETEKSDSINLSDSFSSASSFLRSFSDTVNLSDNFNYLITLILSLSDNISLSDAAIKAFELSQSDSISLSDNETHLSEFFRSLSDTVTMTDNVIKTFGLTEADIVNLADSLSTSVAVIAGLLNFIATQKQFNFTASKNTFNFNAKE